MRKRCLQTVYKMAKENKNIIFLGSDIGAKTLDEFKNEMPERFIMEGIAEQHAIGMAAGLAMSGKTIYVNTIASFITRRCFEQNVLDLGLNNANVRLLANGGGLVYAPLGPTHLACEDICIMRSIPNMSVLVPADADEMERAMIFTEKHQGPIYVRFSKGFGDPIVSKSEHGFEFGKAIVHQEPGDILFIACGTMLFRSLKVAENLKQKGISSGVINMHTIKPLDIDTIYKRMKKAKIVVTIEEHSSIGGLGSAISDIISENNHDLDIIFKKLSLPDEFTDQYGTQNSLIERYGLETHQIEEKVLALYNQL